MALMIIDQLVVFLIIRVGKMELEAAILPARLEQFARRYPDLPQHEAAVAAVRPEVLPWLPGRADDRYGRWEHPPAPCACRHDLLFLAVQCLLCSHFFNVVIDHVAEVDVA
jgi:hypothetical protein